jgi:hypothetical protein
MDNFSKTLAGIFAILFVVATALAFVLYNVEQSVFDAELYIQALEEENFYQRLPDLTAQSLAVAAQRPDRNDMLSLLRNTSEEEWRIFVTELFPPDVLRNLAEDTVTQIMAYLTGERENAILSLTGLKAHLQSPEGVNAIYGILKAQPDCTLEQLTAMALNQQALTLCNPPDSFLFVDLRPIIETQIQGAMSLLPEQITIITADENHMQDLRDLQALRLFMRLSPFLPILCLLVISAFAVRSLNDWLTWWGYPLLLAGLVSISLGAVSGPTAALTFRIFIVSALPDAFPPEILDVFRDLTASIVRNAVRPILPMAGLMALIGLIMVLIAVWTYKKQRAVGII